MGAKHKQVHGDDLIYRFLRDLFTETEGQYGEVPRALLAATGVWFPPAVYETHPVLAPHVVRDPKCRGGKGHPDEWGSPDSAGFLRDDNSLIKGMPKSLSIIAPAQKHLNGRRMATEFVAAHVWRQCTDGGPLASRRPLLNSFVPNLVWLPSQIAKLTDVEGSLVQRTLQEMSWSLYRNAPVEDHLSDAVKEAWGLLPQPSGPAVGHDIDQWNYFVPTPAFFTTRTRRIQTVVDAIDAVLSGGQPSGKVVTSRYTDGLPTVSPPTLIELRAFLARFCSVQTA